MSKKKSHSVYESKKRDCLFHKQFDLWEKSNWNVDLPPFFKRLNNIKDDRSFVILAASVLEYQVDRFLKAFIPKAQILVNRNTNFSMKLKLLKAFRLIPSQFTDMIECIKDIRNDFAHNLEIDSFADAEKSQKLQTHLKTLDRLWIRFKSDMCYWKDNKPLRLKLKDIWRVSIEGLRIYESNVRLFRQETENNQFIDQLHRLSKELKGKREDSERKAVLRTYMPWRG